MITHESSLKEFSAQIRYALEGFEPHGHKHTEFSNIILGGLGGSGIAALMAKSWFFDKADLPIELINDYHLPAYANEKSFVVLNSYSGNTEETLQLYADSKARGCKVIVVTSGGEIGELAESDDIRRYSVKEGFQPRQTLGMGLTYMLCILGELFGQDLTGELTSIAEGMDELQEERIHSAQRIFSFFESSLRNKFVIIADREMYPCAVRFAQQLNENAKLEAFVHLVPESNHNVLESYIDRLPTNFLLLFTEQNVRVGSRFDFLSGHLEMDNNKVLPLAIPGYGLETIFDVNYRLDWVSVFAGMEVGADMMEVPSISSLKEYLSAVEEISEEDEQAGDL